MKVLNDFEEKEKDMEEKFPAVLIIQVLYPFQKLRTLNLAIPVCSNML